MKNEQNSIRGFSLSGRQQMRKITPPEGVEKHSFSERLQQCMFVIAGIRFSNGGKPSFNSAALALPTAHRMQSEGPLRNASCGVPSLCMLNSLPSPAAACRNLAPGRTRTQGARGAADTPPVFHCFPEGGGGNLAVRHTDQGDASNLPAKKRERGQERPPSPFPG